MLFPDFFRYFCVFIIDYIRTLLRSLPFLFPFLFSLSFFSFFLPGKVPGSMSQKDMANAAPPPPLLQPVCKLRRAEKALIRHEITAGRKNPVCDGPDPCPPQAGLSSPKPQSAAVCFFFIIIRQFYNSGQ